MTITNPTATDKQLLAQIAKGDSAALGDLYDLLAATVYGHLLARSTPVELAEQILVQAFRGLWIIAPRLRADASAEQHLIQLAEEHRALRWAA